MDISTLKDTIKTTLSGNADLITFGISDIFEGRRNAVSKTKYPHIVISPIENNEVIKDVNNNSHLTAAFMIAGLISEYDIDTQLTTIFEFEKLIKVALSQDVTLSGKAVKTYFGKTIYADEFFPTKIVAIEFFADYRQIYKTRV